MFFKSITSKTNGAILYWRDKHYIMLGNMKVGTIWWNVVSSKRTTKCQESLQAICNSSFSQEDYQFCINGGSSNVLVIAMT